MAVQAIIEIPALLIAYHSIDAEITGRKWTLFFSYLFITIFSAIAYFTSGVWFIVWVSGAKLFTSTAFKVI
jgi:hypothetical protein